MEIGVKEMEKEVGIMVKFRKGAEGEYREWSVPLEVIEDLWAAAMGEE